MHRIVYSLLIALCIGLLVLWAPAGAQQVRPVDDDSIEMEGFEEIEDLYIVDCLLPGEVRRMGRRMQYLSPRIPVRTTAMECRIRGGEYTAYSRADYRSALNVWRSRAEEGNAEAQHYVGEIHEKGLGIDPDYEEAAKWYKKAADQGYSRSMVNLGYFYERGLGVEQDLPTALEWYRKASGVEGDDLMFASAAQEQMKAMEAELTEALDEAQNERRVLEEQVERLRSELAAKEDQTEADQSTIDTLERLLADADDRVESTEGRLTRLRGSAVEVPEIAESAEAPEPVASDKFEFGRYYALVVGLEQYHYWDRLESPHQDAKRLAEILNERYGFDTTLLLDASAREILSAINDLQERVSEKDNVLIYFAGHGQLLRPEDSERRRGYWLPINAELARTTFWVPNSAINDHLALLEARSVLVVADSCYGGAMSTDPASMMLGGSGPVTEGLIELGLSRQARFVLSSGGLHPVLDAGSGDHSIFARAMIDVLESNSDIMREQDLFRKVSDSASAMIQPLGLEQSPELRPIRQAGHAAGSFFFVPRG